MLKITNKNLEEIIYEIPEHYLVLDIGGAAAPLKRANHIIDYISYEQINWSQAKGGDQVYFNKNTYTQFDICSRKEWPFDDKFFDFSYCSHVLEDIRDPLWVCSEIIRVSKSGYIEVPSRIYESMFKIDSRFFAGASHHRWIIDIYNKKLRFTFKNYYIHSKYLNKTKTDKKNKDNLILKIEWSDSFDYFENWLNSGKEMFEFILDKKISEKQKWNIYRKTGNHKFFGGLLRYIKRIIKK